jgi:hypothetical protein
MAWTEKEGMAADVPGEGQLGVSAKTIQRRPNRGRILPRERLADFQ